MLKRVQCRRNVIKGEGRKEDVNGDERGRGGGDLKGEEVRRPSDPANRH